MTTIAQIKEAYKANPDINVAIAAYTTLIESGQSPADPRDEIYTERGLLYWKLGERALAINDYNEAIRLNPDSRAKQVKEATYSILNYYNKDLYNP